jgi:hypothetical protein
MVQFSAWDKDLSISLSIQTVWGVSPASYFVGVRNVTPVVKPLFHEAHHAPPNAEVKNEWIHTSTPLYIFMVCTGTTLTFILMVMVKFSLCFLKHHTVKAYSLSMHS